jgi:hypothetical protein
VDVLNRHGRPRPRMFVFCRRDGSS